MPKKITIIAILIVFGGISWGVFATSNPHTWTDGLVGYWSFDGQYTTSTDGTKDVSNNGNWGAFNGGVKPVAGISGQALSFDGVDDYVLLPDVASLQPTDAITIEAWIKPNTVSDTSNDIVAIKLKSSVYKGVLLRQKLGGLQFWVGNGTIQLYPLSSSVFQVDNWFHVVGRWDGNEISLWINGQKDSNTAILAGPIQYEPTRTIMIANWSGSWFNGLIDEVRIYSRALGTDEIMQHYLQTRRNLRL